MARWEPCEYGKVVDEIGGGFISRANSDKCAGFFCDAHNADCDAYEATIAALEAELARVKAESLRVVVVGEECALVDLELSECHLFRHVTGGPAYIMDTAIKGRSYTDSGRAHWCARVEGTVKEWSQYDDFAPVQPVRLERWEDADVLGE